MTAYAISVSPNEGGKGSVVSVTSGGSAQGPVNLTAGPCNYLYFSDVLTFMRVGTNPTAGTTDTILPANTFIRIGPVPSNMRLAFRGGANGSVYLSQEA